MKTVAAVTARIQSIAAMLAALAAAGPATGQPVAAEVAEDLAAAGAWLMQEAEAALAAGGGPTPWLHLLKNEGRRLYELAAWPATPDYEVRAAASNIADTARVGRLA